jgi:hypothetical protein
VSQKAIANLRALLARLQQPSGSDVVIHLECAVSGKVQCCPSAKPLVPYTIGCSVIQPRSRFAAEVAAPQLDSLQVGIAYLLTGQGLQ